VRTTSQRGVCMVATAHGVDLQSLLSNPELVPLLGGKQTVILGDGAAQKTNGGHKSRTERKGPPTFEAAVEVLAVDRCVCGMCDLWEQLPRMWTTLTWHGEACATVPTV
jgi:hypothetical protein